MGLMVSYNVGCRKHNPHFYENVDMIRLNSPWYSKDELVDILGNNGKPKFVDVNIKSRTKPCKANHEFEELIRLVGKYDVEWVGISNVEDARTYDEVRRLLGNTGNR